jgi:hypothetical protein
VQDILNSGEDFFKKLDITSFYEKRKTQEERVKRLEALNSPENKQQLDEAQKLLKIYSSFHNTDNFLNYFKDAVEEIAYKYKKKTIFSSEISGKIQKIQKIQKALNFFLFL